MRIEKWLRRFWAVYDDDGELVCVTVYKKGAKEVVRRITDLTQGKTTGRKRFLKPARRD
jgi:hypothetical protein